MKRNVWRMRAAKRVTEMDTRIAMYGRLCKRYDDAKARIEYLRDNGLVDSPYSTEICELEIEVLSLEARMQELTAQESKA